MSYALIDCAVCGERVKRWYSAKLCFPCIAPRIARTGGPHAHAQVARAIRLGQLPHPKSCVCVDCGKPAAQYDHRDYSKPLEVAPVCRSCNCKRGPAKWVDSSLVCLKAA